MKNPTTSEKLIYYLLYDRYLIAEVIVLYLFQFPYKMKSDLKVGFLTSTDPKNKKSWSGTHFRMLNALENEFSNVLILGPVSVPGTLKGIIGLIDILCFLFQRSHYNKNHNILLSLYYGRYYKKKINNQGINVLFAPASSTEIACLNTKIPICYLSDTSFHQINGYYNNYTGFASFSIDESDWIEKKAIKKSKTLVYSSKWAADYVKEYYKTNHDRIFTVKFGPNFDSIPNSSQFEKDYKPPIKILFIGLDWKRKGGDIAYDAFRKLIEMQASVTFTVCGCVPPVTHPNMKVIPYLNKNDRKDNQKIIQLYKESHLLLIPTRADCTPIVFCEAAAFGIPVITTDTGGVKSIIIDDENGYVLPYSANAEEYANKIKDLLSSQSKLVELSKRSREKYELELNWNTWAKKIRKILEMTALVNNRYEKNDQ